MIKILLSILTLVFVLLTIIISNAFFNRMKMPFNSEGNYFDENAGIVYHQQSVMAYGIMAFILLATSVFLVFIFAKNLRNASRV